MATANKIANASRLASTNGLFGIPKTPTSRSHARSINLKYTNADSHFLSLQDRWNDVLSQMDPAQKNSVISRLNAAIKTFKRNHPKIKSFDDPGFRLCRAIRRKLSHILVDTTIQRQLNITWVISIIEHFVAYQAMPIQVYEVPAADVPYKYGAQDSFWASWDGQHTAIAFWIIATMIFGQNPDDVEIPVVEYDMQNRLECRMTFLKNNGKEGKKLLTPIDFVTQQIYAVRLDGVNDDDWLDIEEKQCYLESADLFLTDSKFFDDYEPGAITRVGDVMDEKIHPELIRQFTVYANTVLAACNRPINTKELPIILGFLKMASNDNITYTDSEIENLAYLCISLFDADFDESGAYWEQVGKAYTKWHEDYHKDMDESLRPGVKLNKDWAQGGTFFWYQLRESWKDDQGNAMRLPRLNIQTPFTPSKRNLFK